MRVLIMWGLMILTSLGQSALATPDQEQLTERLKEQLELQNVVVFSHIAGEDTPKGRGAKLLKEEVEKNKNKLLGYTVLQVYPDSLLFKDDKVMKALEQNLVQLAAPSLSELVNLNPKLRIFDFPFLFKDIKEVEDFYKRASEKLFVSEAGVTYLDKDKKYLVLALWHGGMKQLSSNKEINVSQPEPLKNQTFYIQSSPDIASMFESLGAKTVKKEDFAAVYKTLQRKEVDGQENTWSNIDTEKFYKVQQYFIETNQGYLGDLLLASKKFWEKLKEDDKYRKPTNQKTWLEMIDRVTLEVGKQSDELNKRAKDLIKGKFRHKVKENIEKKERKQIEDQIRNKMEESGEKTKTAKEIQEEVDKKIDSKVKQEVKKEFFPFDQANREKWCDILYSEKNYNSWKKFVDEMGKEIVQIAVEGKTGCPFDFFNKMFGES